MRKDPLPMNKLLMRPHIIMSEFQFFVIGGEVDNVPFPGEDPRNDADPPTVVEPTVDVLARLERVNAQTPRRDRPHVRTFRNFSEGPSLVVAFQGLVFDHEAVVVQELGHGGGVARALVTYFVAPHFYRHALLEFRLELRALYNDEKTIQIKQQTLEENPFR